MGGVVITILNRETKGVLTDNKGGKTTSPEIADVSSSNSHYFSVKYLLDFGVLKKTINNEFLPNSLLTRIEFCVLLERTILLCTDTYNKKNKKAIDVQVWYYGELSRSYSVLTAVNINPEKLKLIDCIVILKILIEILELNFTQVISRLKIDMTEEYVSRVVASEIAVLLANACNNALV